MPMASATANWRWPAPRIRASRSMWSWPRRCWPGPGSTRRRWNAARIGPRTRRRRSRWPAPAVRRPRCTTIARASIPASSAPASMPASTIAAMSTPSHALQEMVRDAMADVTGAPMTPTIAASTAARSRPMPCRCRSLALGFARMATGNGLGAGAGQGREAPAVGLHGRALLRRRHRPRRRRLDEGSARPHLRKDRGRRCLLRSASRTWARHCAEMR